MQTTADSTSNPYIIGSSADYARRAARRADRPGDYGCDPVDSYNDGEAERAEDFWTWEARGAAWLAWDSNSTLPLGWSND